MQDKKVLLAFDGSENSFKAVEYVGGIARNCSGCDIMIFYVDGLSGTENRSHEDEWKNGCVEHTKMITDALKKASHQLVQRGIPKECVFTKYITMCRPPFSEEETFSSDKEIADEILKFCKEGGYGTIVLGRHGDQKFNKLILGSVADRIVKSAEDCTVWVVS